MSLADSMAWEKDHGSVPVPPVKNIVDELQTIFKDSDLIGELQDALNSSTGDASEIARIFLTSAVTCLRKNRDYGSSVFKTPVFAPDCPPATSIRVRMSDKFERITNLLKLQLEGGTAKVDESIEDTIMDLGVYCFLSLIAMKR